MATTAKTPAKTPRRPSVQSSSSETPRRGSENFNPNLPLFSSPSGKKPTPCSSPAAAAAPKSVKKPILRSAAKVAPPPPPVSVRDRKFVVAKNKNKRKGDGDKESAKARLQAAYEALRASQEDFFRKDGDKTDSSEGKSDTTRTPGKVEEEKSQSAQSSDEVKRPLATTSGDPEPLAAEGSPDIRDLVGTVKVRKMRSRMLEKAMDTVPEPGAGRVMYLVKVFENALSISKDTESEEPAERNKSKPLAPTWPLPGLQQPPKTNVSAPDSAVASPSMRFSFPPEEDFGANYEWVRSSLDGGMERSRLSLESKASAGSRRNRRHSSDSLGRIGNRRLKVTNLQPFKLRTEQRGKIKEQEFMEKVKQMILEEEKKRIPVAQGLPWTTDEPENLLKPPVKEATEPLEVVLHSDIRAMERAQFDYYVAERMTIADQLRMEREKQRKLEEEEEIRRLRKELVPKAQPMPYFDRPFMPKRSARPRTIPKEPRFHRVRPHKPCAEEDLC